MKNHDSILNKRLDKLQKHYEAISEYYTYIKNKSDEFKLLTLTDRAVLDAYLKRFSSIQDYLGAKIFPALLEVSGISCSKMSEVLYYIEKEEIIDSLSHWIELREIRNDLEHDYPNDLNTALSDLRICIDSYTVLEKYIINSINFAKRYLK